MIKNYLLITWRSMMKNKLFIFINILGLAVGIGCSIVAYFNWEFVAKFDTHHKNADRIYRVSSIREFNGNSTLFGFAPFPMGAIVKQSMPDAEKVVRFSWSSSNFKVDDNLFQGGLVYVDADFFDVFTFEFINGNPADLKDKSKIFLSEEQARKLFNSVDVIGQQVSQVIGSELKQYEVAGVYKKQPMNSSFDQSAYANYENIYDETKDLSEDDWKRRNTLFVMLSDNRRADALTKQLQPFTENNNKVREDFQIREYVLDPFIGMAARDEANDTWSQTKESSPGAAVVTPMIMAGMVLLIACFNMTNSTIAIASRRLKEIGIRKVMGSMRKQLILQFLSETMFVCVLALLIGLFFGELLLRGWNALWPYMELNSHYFDSPGFVIFLAATILITALLSGGYPAFYISKFEPVSILKGTFKFGGTNIFTKILLVLQYKISLLAVIFAVAFYANSVYQENFDIGFNPNNVIVAYVENQGEFQTYRNAIAANKDIIAVAGTQHGIFSGGYNDPIKFEDKELEVDIIDVGDEYVKTMDLDIVAGRDFEKNSETDRRESIIVTERLAKSFGWENPIGKEVIWMDTVKLYVVGVIRDIYTNGLWREMDPLMLRMTSEDKYTQVVAKVPTEKVSDINKFMEAEWKKVFPNRLYNGRVINEGMVEAVQVNRNIVKMCGFLGLIALILSATGLFTLVSLNIIRRMKEIGVRKVLGASIGNITRIINTEFVIMLVIASVLGCAASYFMVDMLMGSIWKYYQSTTSMTFILSVTVMFMISAISIGYKVFSAASMNPVTTLRTE